MKREERKKKGLVVEEKTEEEGRDKEREEETLVGKALGKEGSCRRETHLLPSLLATTAE